MGVKSRDYQVFETLRFPCSLTICYLSSPKIIIILDLPGIRHSPPQALSMQVNLPVSFVQTAKICDKLVQVMEAWNSVFGGCESNTVPQRKPEPVSQVDSARRGRGPHRILDWHPWCWYSVLSGWWTYYRPLLHHCCPPRKKDTGESESVESLLSSVEK